MRRDHWEKRIAALDPDTDWLEIYQISARQVFPWDTIQALSMALFRTYAVPSIGRLLAQTAEFTRTPASTQKRYDDTSLLLDVPLTDGPDSAGGRAAIRRINQMHRRYDIADADMRYVLATFVVVPPRWLARYGKRPYTDHELRATTRYYQELGRRLNIHDIPADHAAFVAFADAYEAEHFGYDAGGRAVADATLDLMAGFLAPGPLRRPARIASLALLDEPLLHAFGYRAPPAPVGAAMAAALRARAALLRLAPARRRPFDLTKSRNIRSYPQGFSIETLGVFGTPPVAAR